MAKYYTNILDQCEFFDDCGHACPTSRASLPAADVTVSTNNTSNFSVKSAIFNLLVKVCSILIEILQTSSKYNYNFQNF